MFFKKIKNNFKKKVERFLNPLARFYKNVFFEILMARISALKKENWPNFISITSGAGKM